jgi:hypothetical protein
MLRSLLVFSAVAVLTIPVFGQSAGQDQSTANAPGMTVNEDALVKGKDCQPLPGMPTREQVVAEALAEMERFYNENHALEGFDKVAYEERVLQIKTAYKPGNSEEPVYYDQLPPKQD